MIKRRRIESACLSATSALLIIFLLQKRSVSCNIARLIKDADVPTVGVPKEMSNGGQTNALNDATNNKEPLECGVFADYGKNYLTPIDVVVKNAESNVACIKARFALSIKVEEAIQVGPTSSSVGKNSTTNNVEHRFVLGYLPLEHVISVEDSCPADKKKEKPTDSTTTQTPSNSNDNKSDLPVESDQQDKKTNTREEDEDDNNNEGQNEQLEMIVTFECGKLLFTFKRDEKHIYVSSIKGVVKLDKKVVREFISTKPIFSTSDVDHHFKYDDIIEVASEAKSKAYILTANFYFTEIEAFRTTTSRDFIKPPDDKSQPFLEDNITNEQIPIINR